MPASKIIVLTPVKNEDWILRPFLRACSDFADHIVLLFQDTDDDSRAIARQFPKAHIVENTSAEYSERSRITQLLAAARAIRPDALLVALDADELPVNSPEALDQWKRLRQLEPGRNVAFKKPDLLPGGRSIVDLPDNWILGFVDDGRAYEAGEVHAQRIPVGDKQPPVQAEAIPLLHLNLVRERVNRAKRRMYCVIESTRGLQPPHRRLLNYAPSVDFSVAGEVVDLPDAWRERLLKAGLDPEAVPEEPPFWQDREVLRHFAEYGERRYDWDPIWDCDWESRRREAIAAGFDRLPADPVRPPPWWINLARCGLTSLIRLLARLRGER